MSHATAVDFGRMCEGYDRHFEKPLLYYAVMHKHRDIVRLLLDTPKVDVNKSRPIFQAVTQGDADVVDMLPSHSGFDPALTDPSGCNALHQASYAGQHEVLRKLLRNGRFDVLNVDQNGFTSLDASIIVGDTRLLDILFENSRATKELSTHNSMLRRAICHRKVNVVRYLTDARGLTLQKESLDDYIASESKCEVNMVAYLLQSGKVLCSQALYRALAAGQDLDVVQCLLKDGRVESKFALYHRIASKQSKDIVECLLEQDRIEKQYALYYAIKFRVHNAQEVFELLLRHKQVDCENVLSHAAKSHYGPKIFALFLAEPRVSVRMKTGVALDTYSSSTDTNMRTGAIKHEHGPPLCVAAEEGQLDVVDTLLKHPQVNPAETNANGENALHCAARTRNRYTIERLLRDERVEKVRRDSNGVRPIDYECVQDALERETLRDMTCVSSNQHSS